MATEFFSFEFERTLQAAAYLLKKYGQAMPYILLLKLLYMADREYLMEEGEMVTGDRVFAMEYGPVLSGTYNMIKAEDSRSGQWEQFFQRCGEYDIRMIRDPGDDVLCEAIRDKLDSVFQRFGNQPPFDVVDKTHQFKEWQAFYKEGTSTAIPWQEILKLNGCEAMIPIAEENIQMQQEMNLLEMR